MKTDIPRMSMMIIAIRSVSMPSPQIGGIVSTSMSPVGDIQHARTPPWPIRKSSIPGGMGSGISTCPDIKRTRHVPQVPEVQFVGMETSAASAWSMTAIESLLDEVPIGREPRKKRTVVDSSRPTVFLDFNGPPI